MHNILSTGSDGCNPAFEEATSGDRLRDHNSHALSAADGVYAVAQRVIPGQPSSPRLSFNRLGHAVIRTRPLRRQAAECTALRRQATARHTSHSATGANNRNGHAAQRDPFWNRPQHSHAKIQYCAAEHRPASWPPLHHHGSGSPENRITIAALLDGLPSGLSLRLIPWWTSVTERSLKSHVQRTTADSTCTSQKIRPARQP